MAVRRTPTPRRRSRARPPKSPLTRYGSSRGAPTRTSKATLPSRSLIKKIRDTAKKAAPRPASPPLSFGAIPPSRPSRGTLSASFRKTLKTAAAKAATPRRRKAREAASVGSGTKTTSLRSPRKAVGRTIRGRRNNAGGTPSRRAN